MDDKSLLSLLPLTPTLTILTIADNGELGSGTGTKKMITNHFLARLSFFRETVGGFGTDCNTSADMLIPHIKDLSLVINDFEGLDEKLLVSVLASRLPDTSRILPAAQRIEHDTPTLNDHLGSINITLTGCWSQGRNQGYPYTQDKSGEESDEEDR
ncbi:hypothetical protein AAF712_012781 [Marasmius tenuissimus]|uniref:Uncharacterized protein n=1 Tax=Marasmius tenuissimus TaxID=585030 RepID=A0ABR2ZGP6_9AGAR